MIGYYEKCMRCTNKYPKINLIRKVIFKAKLRLWHSSFYKQKNNYESSTILQSHLQKIPKS